MSAVHRDWLPEAWAALDKALKQKRKAVAAAKRAPDTMDDSIELHAPEDGLQVPSKSELTGRPGSSRTRRRKPRQPPRPRRLRLRMTGLPDPMIRSLVRLSHPVCRW